MERYSWDMAAREARVGFGGRRGGMRSVGLRCGGGGMTWWRVREGCSELVEARRWARMEPKVLGRGVSSSVLGDGTAGGNGSLSGVVTRMVTGARRDLRNRVDVVNVVDFVDFAGVVDVKDMVEVELLSRR